MVVLVLWGCHFRFDSVRLESRGRYGIRFEYRRSDGVGFVTGGV